jgi:pimeloyl-ACP methyl ester carboxylesterase
VVVVSGGAAVPIQLSGPPVEWVLALDLGGFRAIDPRAIIGAALETIEGYRPPPEVRENYLESYEGDRFVESMRYARPYPNELPQLAGRLPEISALVPVIAGRRDRVVPLSNAGFLDERLPDGKLVVGAGRLVWEERAGGCACVTAGVLSPRKPSSSEPSPASSTQSPVGPAASPAPAESSHLPSHPPASST